MLKEPQWFKIALGLRDFLKSFKYDDGTELFTYLEDRKDLIIRLGKGNTGEWPAIWIYFGQESETEGPDNVNGGVIQLWVDVFVKGTASAEIDQDLFNYNQVFNVERELISLMNKFRQYMAKNGILIDLYPVDILSDGDTNAPVVVRNRIVMDIKWHKNKY